MSRTCVAALAVAALLTACGSTVQSTSRQIATASPDGIAAPSTRATAASSPLAAGETAAPPTTSDGSPATDDGASSTTGAPLGGDTTDEGGSSSSTTGAVVEAPSGPGVAADSITLGIAYDPDSGSGDAAIGASGTDSGDVRTYYNALFSEINASGGVAGRKLKASYFAASSASTASAQTVQQAACDQWTRDEKAFAVFDVNDENSRSCLGKRGALALSTGASNSLSTTFTRFPYYVEVSSIALDRSLRATAEGLASLDYYGSKPVIGVIAWDDTSYRFAVQRSLLPALRGLGHPALDPVYVKVPNSINEISGSSADVSSAVLRFRQEGVTHVFIVDGPAGVFGGTGLTLLFIKDASSQQYFPRYGMNDSNSPQGGLDAGLWQARDVRGSRVVSSSNILDASDAGITPNAARKACLALMKRHGITPSNVNQRGFIIRACEYVEFVRTVLGRQRIPVNRDVFLARVNALGAAFSSPSAYRTFFSRSQHDGVAGLRREALDDGCGCYVYLGGIYVP